MVSGSDRADLNAALDAAVPLPELVADICRLVEEPSYGGVEESAQHVVADIATRLGLDVSCYEEDIDALREASGYPGEEVTRDRLLGVTVTVPGADRGAPRLCFNGHVDVVPPGAQRWTSDPFRAVVSDGRIHGRGAADMKSGLVSALYAMAAVQRVLGSDTPGDIVLQSVAAEEDGGLGAFAALRRDSNFAGCVIPEPTGGSLVCAQAGALTWTGRVPGCSAHASNRLDGVSALTRFLPIHRALEELERELNESVDHPLMRELALPYPLSIGRVQAGDWASSVPDELVFEGRVGVPIGRTPDEVRRRLEDVVAAATDDAAGPVEIAWTGGQFAPAETPSEHPFVHLVQDTIRSVEAKRAELVGIPAGTDLRFYTDRGIPTVLYGPGEMAQAHVVDEYVTVSSIAAHVRVLARLAAGFGSTTPAGC